MEAELTQHKGIIDLSSKLHANVRRNVHNYSRISTSQNKVFFGLFMEIMSGKIILLRWLRQQI